MLSVPCPNSATFLNTEPKSAVPVGKVEGLADALEHGVSAVGAGVTAAVHT